MSDQSLEPLLEADSWGIASIEDDAVRLVCSGRDPITVSASHLGHSSTSPLWEGASVMLVTLRHPSIPGMVRLPILEPDYLVDVTEIAEAWQPDGSGAESILLNRIRSRSISHAMARGSLLNTVFDLAVADHTATDDDLITRAVQTNVLPWAAFAHRGVHLEAERQGLLPIVASMRQQLRSWLAPQPHGSALQPRLRVEPHAISPVLGLAGRFDILLEADHHCTLVELKSGSAPRHGGRPSHIAQLSCYAALHLAVEGRWPDDVMLWYAAAPPSTSPSTPALRSVAPEEILRTLQSVLPLRNAAVSMDHALAMRSFGALRSIGPSMPGVSDFAREAANRFQEAYSHADPVVRTACQGWLSMLHQERWVQRVGTTEQGHRPVRSRADLWRESVETKRHDPSCITDLLIDESASDFERMHLTFQRHDPIAHTSLRYGDLVVLHRQDVHQPTGRFIIKSTIEALHETSIRVSLRNKQVDRQDLLDGCWILEADLSDKAIRDAMPGAVAMLFMNPRRQNLLLGRMPASAPHHGHQPPTPLSLAEATPSQVRVIRQALAQPELFLLQGPPGTGKTNIALRSIVANLAATPGERILVLAFTNRAVSEICTALSSVLPHGQLIRHGSKVGGDETQNVPAIPHLARTLSPQDLAQRVETARVVVATMSSIVGSADIFEFGRFTTAIVDEASQLIEPLVHHVALRVHRLILIGDHAQLPPVITQPSAHLAVNAPQLHAVGLDHLGRTTFERLFTIYQSRGWTDGSAMLIEQGRMHQDVMRMPSTIFYGERLAPVLEWQRSRDPLPWHHIIPHRAAFIPVVAEGSSRQAEHQQALEGAMITWLLEHMFNNRESTGAVQGWTIGVITPFRLQNHAIGTALTELPATVRSAVTIDTVERFQGSQRDVIIYGTAVATAADVRTITSETVVDGRMVDRKLNVASTRARQQFIIVGHPEILMQAESYAAALRQLPWVPLQDRIDLHHGRS